MLRYAWLWLAGALALAANATSPSSPLPSSPPPSPLPDSLTLEYLLYYEDIEIGLVSKTLKKTDNGLYRHTMWTRPTGLARTLFKVQWREDGEFLLRGTEVQPQWFREIRSGDKRAYERRVDFDWSKNLLAFSDGRREPLPAGAQDQSSILYSLMASPVTPGQDRTVFVTNAKDIKPYKFIVVGRETLGTRLGSIETVVLKRLSTKQMVREELCKKEPDHDECTTDDFMVWLAPSRNNVPVKLRQRKGRQVMSAVLKHIGP